MLDSLVKVSLKKEKPTSLNLERCRYFQVFVKDFPGF